MKLIRTMSIEEFNMYLNGDTIKGNCYSHNRDKRGYRIDKGKFVYFFEYKDIMEDIERFHNNWAYNKITCIFETTKNIHIKTTYSTSAYDDIEYYESRIMHQYSNKSLKLIDVIINK